MSLFMGFQQFMLIIKGHGFGGSAAIGGVSVAG
jgi:hypothetical protein